MARGSSEKDDGPARLDAVARWRSLLGPSTLSHLAFKEKLRAHYVETYRDELLRNEMEMIIENTVLKRQLDRPAGADNRGEGTAIAIVAESGAGKSRAMLHYLDGNEFFAEIPGGGRPLIRVAVKAPAILRNLGMATLRAAGYASRIEKLQSESWAQVQFLLRDLQTLVVNYEECQRIIQNANRKDRKLIVETFAGLLTDLDWPVSLIFSGLPALESLFQTDFIDLKADPKAAEAHDTLRRRTRFVPFPSIDLEADRKDLDRGLREYQKIGDVSLALLAHRSETRARLHHAASRQFGLFWQYVVSAIDICVRSERKEVAIDDFADGYAAETQQPLELNPFAVDHWETIDTSVVQHREQEETPEPKKARPERRREHDK
ncbi:hypothetical protein BDS110ZK4_30300 [Bradyrhizobium diazoefficiens]|uniref:ATP-binding protein n=1 Tax=Bradyrhizobium diazoefficiens TaxID=1355477 RepID=A0A810CV84_9BRAD|nr:hypothetical protein XF4B_44970 [Bradyrhizobium diazoefficiens]BCE91664.1 hypothetical protein XF10B_44620 [Bradyrhizobium diazoefficiens]